jgi:peroxiredoxin
MTLRQLLRSMMTTEDADYRAALDELAARLRRSALTGVLKRGAAMPSFALPDEIGRIVSSDDLLAKGPLIVVLFRGGWCPYCEATLTALDQIVPDIEAAGASLVALTPDTGEYAARTRQSFGVSFPILSDLDSTTALQFGAVYRLPDSVRRFFDEDGLDLAVRHGNPFCLLPMPATFLVDRAGVIRYVHASGDITDRAEPEDIASRLRTIA